MTANPDLIVIGQRVEATFIYGEPTITGRLLHYADDGTVEIEDEAGVVHLAGPAKDIRRLDHCDTVYAGELWAPSPCERAPDHIGWHCDMKGRTWT